MTFTPEQLRQFAEAGGWQFKRRKADVVLVAPDGQETCSAFGPDPHATEVLVWGGLPDFPTNLAACFEVLNVVTDEWELQRSGKGFQTKYYPKNRVERIHGSIELKETDAIIAAVLAAKEANGRH